MILAYISVALGVAGIAYGIYQDRLRIKIARQSRAQAWSTYQTSKNALGFFLDYMKSEDAPPETPYSSQAHARLDELYQKTIQHVISQYPKVTPEEIEKWLRNGRINDYAVESFKIQTCDD